MHTRTGSRSWLFAIALISLGGNAPHAWADNTADTSQPATLDTVTVTAAKLRSLEQFTPTGSRLGLSAQELPATLEVIDNDEMLGRGFFNVQQAADSQAGVTSGGSPGDQSQFSMRGFTGNQITVLRNGLYIGPSNMTTRDQNSFNVGSVEILKGLMAGDRIVTSGSFLLNSESQMKRGGGMADMPGMAPAGKEPAMDDMPDMPGMPKAPGRGTKPSGPVRK